MHKTLDDIDALKARWMTGGGRDTTCPDAWQGLDELALLAVVGQFTRIATRPASAGGFDLRPDIPPLPLPAMPEKLRPHFRRILDSKLATPADVVRLIAARGYGVNPIDWMPKRSDTDLPAAYDPWHDWMDGNIADYANDDLTADNWDRLPTHSRHRELTALHSTDPDAARRLINTVAPTLGADQRLRMLECVRPGLTNSDKSLLESFAGDRSSKVQTFIKVQLARLGLDAVPDGDASPEVLDFLAVQRAGMLTRRKIVTAPKLKNDAQRKRRKTVLGSMSVKSLADRLNLSPDDLIEMWDFGGATDDIADVVATSGTDMQVDRFAKRLVEHDSAVPQSLMDRVSVPTKTTLGLRILMKDDWHFNRTKPWFPAPDGSVSLPNMNDCKPLADLITMTAQSGKAAHDQMVATALNFLALMVDRDTAGTLVDQLLAVGVLTVDPRLTLLRLNAAL